MSGFVKAGQTFLKALMSGGKQKTTGEEVISKVTPNVPVTKADKVKRDLRLATQKTKASQAKLDNTIFRIEQQKKRLETGPGSANPRRPGKMSGGRIGLKRGSFPDLSGDGKTTMKDILIGRGVIKKGKKKMMAKKSETPMDKAIKKKNKKRII